MLEQGAGNAEPLLLPAGNIHAALAHVGIQAVRHPLQKFISAGGAAGGPQGFVIGVGITPAQVVTDSAGEQQVLLQHNAHSIPQGSKVIPAHILPADLDGAGGSIVQAGDQLYQRCFCRAGAADNAHRCPGGNVQRNVGKGIPSRSGAVFEADVRKINAAVGNGGNGVSRGGQRGLLLQHGTDAPGAGQGAGKLQKHAGEHHDRVEHLQNIAQKGGQLADRHPVSQNKIAAVPHDADNGRVHNGLERGQVEHGIPEGVGAGGGQLVIDGFKLLILVIAAHKRFDGADGG